MLMRTSTGLVRVGKDRPQHMSKLYDNADVRRARGALRALVLRLQSLNLKSGLPTAIHSNKAVGMLGTMKHVLSFGIAHA